MGSAPQRQGPSCPGLDEQGVVVGPVMWDLILEHSDQRLLSGSGEGMKYPLAAQLARPGISHNGLCGRLVARSVSRWSKGMC